MKYIKATIEDLPLLIHFRKTQLIQNGASEELINDEELKKFFEFHLNNNTLCQFIVYDQDQAIATGGILFYHHPPSHVNQTGIIGYITNMFTLPSYRRQGIASKLLELLEKEALERNVHSLTLNATIHGSSLYKKCGFSKGHLETLEKKI